MTTPEIIRLVLLAAVFLIWAAVLLNVARTLRRRVAAQTAPATTLGAIRHWLRAPEDKSTRNTLAMLSFALLVMVLSRVFLSGP